MKNTNLKKAIFLRNGDNDENGLTAFGETQISQISEDIQKIMQGKECKIFTIHGIRTRSEITQTAALIKKGCSIEREIVTATENLAEIDTEDAEVVIIVSELTPLYTMPHNFCEEKGIECESLPNRVKFENGGFLVIDFVERTYKTTRM